MDIHNSLGHFLVKLSESSVKQISLYKTHCTFSFLFQASINENNFDNVTKNITIFRQSMSIACNIDSKNNNTFHSTRKKEVLFTCKCIHGNTSTTFFYRSFQLFITAGAMCYACALCIRMRNTYKELTKHNNKKNNVSGEDTWKS